MKAFTRSPQEKRDFAEQKCSAGVSKMINKNYDKALMYFTWAIRECPDVEQIYTKRSECYMIIGDNIRALSDAHDALKLNPNSAEAKTRISDTLSNLEKSLHELVEQKRFDDCVEIIEKALRVSPACGDLILISENCIAKMINQGYGAEEDFTSEDDNERETSDVNLLTGSIKHRGSKCCDANEIPRNTESNVNDSPEKGFTPRDMKYAFAYCLIGLVTFLLIFYFLRFFYGQHL